MGERVDVLALAEIEAADEPVDVVVADPLTFHFDAPLA